MNDRPNNRPSTHQHYFVEEEVHLRDYIRVLRRRWKVFAVVFSLGAALAGFSGMIDAPLSSVYPGMGDFILISSFVVIVIGGIGSVKGAFVGAMLVGLADTFGKVLLPEFSSMVIYALMALILMWRPQGLFGRQN